MNSSASTQRLSAHASAALAVRTENLTRAFGDNVILRDIDLQIAAGEFVVLLGVSGSGKTTLLRLLADLDQPSSGSLIRPSVKAVVFQEPRLMPWMNVAQNVALGLKTPDADERVASALKEVGLTARADAWPATLSGGEAQRVALARALVREPGLLLLDEPFSALDAITRMRMHQLTLDLWATHRPAVLMVTHDIHEAFLLADRIIVLSGGRPVADMAIAEPRPREPDSPVFRERKAELLRLLGVDHFSF